MLFDPEGALAKKPRVVLNRIVNTPLIKYINSRNIIMQTIGIITVAAFMIAACGPAGNAGHSSQNTTNTSIAMTEKDTSKAARDTTVAVNRTDEEWKKALTPEQYHVLREKGTDAPYTGRFYLSADKGMYVCAGCGAELFSSDMKFQSSCGWPSFDREIEGGKIRKVVDKSYGMTRTEIVCARCGSHLGHLFDDGPTSTGMRYCVNSTSLGFQKDTTAKK